jgi:hypothetical protein
MTATLHQLTTANQDDEPLEIEIADAAYAPAKIVVRNKARTFLFKVLTIDEFTDFDMGWTKLMRLSGRNRPERTTDEELAKEPLVVAGVPKFELDGTTPILVHVLSDDDLARRRLKAMTPEQLKAHDERRDAEDRWARSFTYNAIRDFVKVAEGQITINKKPCITGADILSAFRQDRAFLQALMLQIQLQNNVTEDQKKIFESLLASATTSAAPGASRPAANGPKQATTAENADREDSAPVDAASQERPTTIPDQAATSSGSQATSS